MISHMWNLKKNDMNKLTFKTEIDLQAQKKKKTYGYQGGKGRGEINQEFGI